MLWGFGAAGGGTYYSRMFSKRGFPFELYSTLLTTLDKIGSSKLLDRMLSQLRKRAIISQYTLAAVLDVGFSIN